MRWSCTGELLHWPMALLILLYVLFLWFFFLFFLFCFLYLCFCSNSSLFSFISLLLFFFPFLSSLFVYVSLYSLLSVSSLFSFYFSPLKLPKSVVSIPPSSLSFTSSVISSFFSRVLLSIMSLCFFFLLWFLNNLPSSNIFSPKSFSPLFSSLLYLKRERATLSYLITQNG